MAGHLFAHLLYLNRHGCRWDQAERSKKSFKDDPPRKIKQINSVTVTHTVTFTGRALLREN